MGNDEARAAPSQFGHGTLDEDLGAGIDRTGRLIEDEHGGVGEERTCNREELSLTGADVLREVGEQRLVALGEGPDEVLSE